jgi:serpin B
MRRFHLGLLAGLLAALGCERVDAQSKGGGTMAKPLAAVVEGNNRFAFDLHGKVRGGGGNLFYSPFSISTALAMTATGARGATAREMAETLHVPDDPATRLEGFKSLLDAVNGAGASAPAPDILVTANALWLQSGEPFLPAFLDAAKAGFGAAPFEVDFQSDPSAARKTINDWVEEQTRKKIRDLLGPTDVDPSTTLVLTNAIYYKGLWAFPFREPATDKAGVFTTAAGEKVTVPMMRQLEFFRVYDGGTFRVLELPYKGLRRSMLVVLPKKTDGLDALEASISAKAVDGWVGKLARGKVDLWLPKFRLEAKFQLADVLRSLGMATAFQPSAADFSGMTGRRDRAISAVIHKAFVDVDEQGTEAAAATGVVMTRSAMPRPEPIVEFHADHPFLFLIRDQATGATLFLGRMNRPGS